MKTVRFHQKRSCVRGFSLLELLIVVVLLASMLAIVIPSLRALTDAKVKEEVTRIAEMQNDVAMAAISVTHRINFDLDNNTYWVEVREAEAGEIAPDLAYDELVVALRARQNDEKDKSKKLVPQFKKAEGKMGEKYELPKGLRLYGVWTEELKEVARTGVVPIYFFADGFTQASFVSVIEGDDKDSAIFIALNPLTGAWRIDYGEPTIKSLLDVENADEK